MTDWQKELKKAHAKERKWREKSKEIYNLYRDDRGDDDTEFRFNILWANTETQRPALFSSTPIPDVRRRISKRFDQFQNEDLSKFASIMVERALEFSLDPGSGQNFESFGQKCISDFLLPGRIVAKIDYEPTYGTVLKRVDIDPEEPETDEVRFQDDKGFYRLEEEEDLVWEEVSFTRFSPDMFRMDPSADCWEDVQWVAFGYLMTKADIENEETFTVNAEEVPFGFTEAGERVEEGERERKGKFALVWQIWSKPDRKVIPIVEGFEDILSGRPLDDPLNLQNFYPCPEPAYILPDPETLIPTPEFRLYQDQAREIDRMTSRIASLITVLKLVGIYAGEDKTIVNQIAEAKDGDLIPVQDHRLMLEKGGLSGVIDWLPIDDIIKTIQALIAERADLIRQVFELTGISDIQRGATDPRETRGAQVIKANFATRRLLIKQQTVARFFRDLYRMAGELMVEKFSPRMLAAMTAIDLEKVNQILPVMRQDGLRSFRIDIETDSTVAPDELKEKEGVAEFISALSRMFGAAAPLVQLNPASAPAIGQIILWAMRKFKITREVEDELTAALSQQPQQQGDPEGQAKAQEAMVKIQEMMQEMQQKQIEFQIDIQDKVKDIQRKDAETEVKIGNLLAERERKAAESEARIRAQRAR